MANAVDPQQLLKALAPLLTQTGAMKNAVQVPRISGLMNGARKLVSRCIYINILQATEDEQLLKSFVEGGGWDLLNCWLQEAKESDNSAFISNLLLSLKKLPVTIDTLKKNNTAKLVKQMSKSETNETLRSLAETVVSEWMKIIKQTHENTETKASTSSPVTTAKKKKVAKKLKTEDGSDTAEPILKKLKRETSEMNHEKTRKKISPEKRNRLSLRRSPKSEDGKMRIPKKNDAVVKEEQEEKPRVVAKIKRPAHTKFRSTGLEKESSLPPNRFKKKQPPAPLPSIINKSEKTLLSKREGPIFGKSLLPPEKKPKVDDITSSATKTTPSSSSSSSPTTIFSTTTATTTTAMATSSVTNSNPSGSSSNSHGRIKLIPAKPKIMQESSHFMDALNAPAVPIRKIKVKKQSKPTSPTTNKDVKPDPPKFRFYSTGQNEDEEGADKSETKEDDPDVTSQDKDQTSSSVATSSNLKLIPSKSKKCVNWKEDDKLVDICYFDMDETERVNVNRPKDFRDAAHLEIIHEREAMKNAKLQGPGEKSSPFVTTNGEDFLAWKAPARLNLFDIQTVDNGCSSVERGLQKQREMIVLQEIYFDKKMIPDTPKEPDPEPFEPREPKRIPLEDETATPSQGTPVYSDSPPPGVNNPHHVPPGLPPSITLTPGLHMDNLPPAIASLVHHIPQGAEDGQGGLAPQGGPGRPHEGAHGGPPGQNATINNVQNLLNSIMGNQQVGAQPSHDDLTNKLRDMLEPFKNQLPGSLTGPPPQRPPPPPPPVAGLAGGPAYGPPEGWAPRGPSMPGHVRGGGGMPPYGGPGRGFNHPYQRPPIFNNGPHPFPGGGPEMAPRGPPRGHPRGPPRGAPRRGRGRGAPNFGTRPICRHFMSPRGCERDHNCQFYHPGVNGPPLP